MKNLSERKLFGLSILMLIVGAILFFTNVSFGPTTATSSTVLLSLSFALFAGGIASLISSIFRGLSGR